MTQVTTTITQVDISDIVTITTMSRATTTCTEPGTLMATSTDNANDSNADNRIGVSAAPPVSSHVAEQDTKHSSHIFHEGNEMKTLVMILSISVLAGQGIAQTPTYGDHYPTTIQPQYPLVGRHLQTAATSRHATRLPVGSRAHLRENDRLAVQLLNDSKSLHDQHHAFLTGQHHAEKLDEDITALERESEALHSFAISADGSAESILRLRSQTNQFLQLSFRIARTIDLTEPWLRGHQASFGIRQMRMVSKRVINTALNLDAYLPVDPTVIDGQAEILEAAIKELHDEFHEHLEGYEVSRHLDDDLEEVETLVEHMHELAHNTTWQQMNLSHLVRDLNQVKQKTAHIESLFVQQARIGVRTHDWVGIEHARDAITDILSSAYLLEHMIQKSAPVRTVPLIDSRPLRDRHGHPIRPVRRYGQYDH
jgi:hypothetical protein